MTRRAGWCGVLLALARCELPAAAAPWDAGLPCAEVPPPEGTPVGRFALRQYWIADERDFRPHGGPATVLCDDEQATLSLVSASFAFACRLNGTCRLSDGRLINAARRCDCEGGVCFKRLSPRRYPWGKGSDEQALEPFTSVAVDGSVIAAGTRLYAPELRGLKLPDGRTHDGCLRADDHGGGIRGQEMDLFVGTLRNWNRVQRRLPPDVAVYVDPPRCTQAI